MLWTANLQQWDYHWWLELSEVAFVSEALQTEKRVRRVFAERNVLRQPGDICVWCVGGVSQQPKHRTCKISLANIHSAKTWLDQSSQGEGVWQESEGWPRDFNAGDLGVFGWQFELGWGRAEERSWEQNSWKMLLNSYTLISSELNPGWKEEV